MVQIIGGKLWQWDTGRKIKITPKTAGTIAEVHYCSAIHSSPLVLEPRDEDGVLVCDIPEELLHSCKDIKVFLVCKTEDCARTVHEAVLPVNPRPQPVDFKYASLQDMLKSIIDRTVERFAVSKGVTIIGKSAFADCTELVSITIPEGVTEIEYGAFSRSGLRECSLPGTLTSIKMLAFHCAKLESIVIPKNVTEIATNAFALCLQLEEVTFKGTPTKIDSSSFSNCDALANINVPWAEGEVAGAPWGATNATINYNYKEA